MTKISSISTTLAAQSDALYLEAEKSDGTSAKIPANLIGIIGRQVITTTGAGTYTPTAGTKSILIQLIGGGGGGGGVPQPTGSNGAAGRGGGAGAYLEKRLTSGFSGASYNVGPKGAGGAAGNNAGSAGGDTTFGPVSGTTYTAAGGAGGASEAGGAVPRLAGAAAGGAATNGAVNITGGQSDRGLIASTSQGFGSRGGTGPFAMGVAASIVSTANSSSAGNAATGKGGGGGGAIAVGTGAAAAGGNGSDGMIIIWEFSN